MSILDVLNSWDTALLLMINGANSPFCDDCFFLLSEKLVWFPLLVSLLIILFIKQKRQALWTIVFVVLTIVMADQLASGVIKPLVQRFRPTHDPALEGLVHVVHGYRGGLYGFISSHASNGFAIALLLTLLLRTKLFGATMFVWAFLSSYTRMYLGVHYPGDVLCGALLGLLVAWGMYGVICKVRPDMISKVSVLSLPQEMFLSGVFCFTIIFCCVFHRALVPLFLG